MNIFHIIHKYFEKWELEILNFSALNLYLFFVVATSWNMTFQDITLNMVINYTEMIITNISVGIFPAGNIMLL